MCWLAKEEGTVTHDGDVDASLRKLWRTEVGRSASLALELEKVIDRRLCADVAIRRILPALTKDVRFGEGEGCGAARGVVKVESHCRA